MTQMILNDRQKRERDYYEQYSQLFDCTKKIDLSPVQKPLQQIEQRPWNSYWKIYQLAIEKYFLGSIALDFGCGPGDNSIRFASIGYKVKGFDISQANINMADKVFLKYFPDTRPNFIVSTAENLPYEDNSFDIIIGIDILHHVDIEKSIKECWRVLKPRGSAIFREPIEVKLFETIRNLWIIKKIFPKSASFENHITEDEKKLTSHDLKIIEKTFLNLEIERFLFLSRLDKIFRKKDSTKKSLLEVCDYYLFKFFPFLKPLGGAVIIKLKKGQS